jgi:transcriptional regulator with XRE-family HTH domain
MIERKNILENIAKIRNSKGFSQDYVASRLNMKQSGYALIENGNRGLQYEILLQLAIVFSMDIIDIITYPEVYSLTKDEKQSTKVKMLVEIDVSEDEFIKLGFKDKVLQVFSKQ